MFFVFFFFSSRRRHTRSLRDWSSDVCSSDLHQVEALRNPLFADVLQAPGGVNLLWNTAVVAPAAILWPVTAAFGPIVSYNVRSEERRVGKECRTRGSTCH